MPVIEPPQASDDSLDDDKLRVVTVKLQPDLYRWLLHEARQRRATISYVIRDLVNQAAYSQKGNVNG